MATCREIDALVTPFIDGEAAAGDRAAVAAHLETCTDCRNRVEAERTARQAIRTRAATLVGRAPVGLHARCADALRPSLARPSRMRTVAGLSMAAALVLVVAGVLAYALSGRSSTVFAAELTLDHLKCFSFFEGSAGPGDAVRLEARLQQAYGWRLAVPSTSPDGRLKLIGARRCITTDGRIAHILYRYEGRPLSLFVLPSTERPSDRVRLFGYEAWIWSRGGATYVVIAEEPDSGVDRAAAYLKDMTK